MKAQSDEQLMEAVARGNLDAMTPLFERYHKWIFNFLYQMQPNTALCEDITQQVFYKAIRYRTSYSGGKFSSWIFKIARNLFADHCERQKKMTAVSLDQLVVVDEKEADVSEEIRRLKIVLNRLPVADKELMVMSRFQNMRYHEIAEVIGSNEVAVKTRIYRIIKKMRTIYFEKKTG